MTTVTVLAGERTIGGTQVVVEDDDARLLFDCGIAFQPARNPFSHVRRRPDRTLADLVALDVAPYVPGLYGSQVPRVSTPYLPEATGPLMVALSHSHLDHSHLTRFIDPNVPVYASQPAASIIRALGETEASLGYVERPISVPMQGQFAIGPIRVTMVPVDHDVGGAVGMLIETTDGTIAYSGDLRLHGSHPERTLDFVAAAREAGACLLILEGTRLTPSLGSDEIPPPLYDRVEAQVAPDIVRVLKTVSGRLAIVLLTPENGERVEALAATCADAGRLLVLDVESAALATAALGHAPLSPHAVYVPTAYRDMRERVTELTPVLAAALTQAEQVVTTDILASDPGSFLLQLPFPHFADLLDLLSACAGGLICTANGPPLGRFDPAWHDLEWWATFLGMQIVEVGSTGHAAPRDLALIAAHSGAPVVMSLHSHYPELMPVPRDHLLLPRRGERYDLDRIASYAGLDGIS